MTPEQLLLVTVAFAGANAVILLILFLRILLGARPATTTAEAGVVHAGAGIDVPGAAFESGAAEGVATTLHPDDRAEGDLARGISASAYHRVVRIAGWAFIMATAALVAGTGLWRESEGAIAVVLGVTGLFLLIVHDVLPEDSLGAPAFVVEGTVAVTVATFLVLLTGQDRSPFFFVYPLIVAGAALVIPPRATAILLGGSVVGYLVAVLIQRLEPLDADAITRMAVNLVALVLLAYVAAVISREHRATLGVAIHLASRDPLTGLVNRSVLFSAMDREIARSARSGRGFCLLMMDLDELKAINDRQGHIEGDRVLRQVGQAIRSGVRRIDVAARYGGDEFVVLLPETDPTGGYVLAEKIRQNVAELGPTALGHAATLSIGVVSWPRDGRSIDELLVNADQAMYRSKRAGRNRVMGMPTDVGGWTRQSV